MNNEFLFKIKKALTEVDLLSNLLEKLILKQLIKQELEELRTEELLLK